MSVESANQADTLSDLLSTKKVNLASLELVGSGVYSLVYRLRGHDVVVKTVAEVGLAHHAIETSIYKRLGRHISILSYLGEVDVLGSEEVMRGLIVAYCVGGTLEDFLKYPKHDQEYDERKLQSVQKEFPYDFENLPQWRQMDDPGRKRRGLYSWKWNHPW